MRAAALGVELTRRVVELIHTDGDEDGAGGTNQLAVELRAW
jgi:hypothetical protein